MSLRKSTDFDARYMPAYPISHVSRKLRISLATLRSWVRGRSDSPNTRPIIQLPYSGIPQLSFVNLIEAYVLKSIRADHGVPLKNIRAAIVYLERVYGHNHALADVDFLTDRRDLFFERMGEYVNASQGGQMAFRDLAEIYLKRIDRNNAGQAACLYPVIGDNPFENKLIVIDPYISFGRSRLVANNVPTDIIYDRFCAGDSLEELAAEYEHGISDIERVIQFEQQTAKKAA